MSAPICTSRWACMQQGLRGTAHFLCAAGLAWAVFSGAPLWPLVPGALALAGALMTRGVLGAALSIIAMGWTVAALNNWSLA